MASHGGSPSEAASAAASAAKGAGASREDASRVAGEAAGAAVVHVGGSEREVGAAAVEGAREAGGSSEAQTQVHVASVSGVGGNVPMVARVVRDEVNVVRHHMCDGEQYQCCGQRQ